MELSLGRDDEVRAGLTNFIFLLKIGTESVSTKPCSSEGFHLSPCIFANESSEVGGRGLHLPHLLQIDVKA